MPIQPGLPWGVVAAEPAPALYLVSDRSVGRFLRDNTAKIVHSQNLCYQAGDLETVLGLTDTRDRSQRLKVIVDAISVEYTDLQGKRHHDVCFGSLHIGNRLFRGALSIVSNSGLWRGREVAPRAHPNDGKLDIVEISPAMRWNQRMMAWRRTRIGTHLPHPLIQYSQGEFFSWSGTSQRLIIDGEFVSRVQQVSCRIQSDCVAVFV